MESEMYFQGDVADLPLFAPPATSNAEKARTHHEKKSARAYALDLLRDGVQLTDVLWKEHRPGSRVAPVVDKLRNAHGFTINGEGSVKIPYVMPIRNQFPALVESTDEIKNAYWSCEHWREMRERRYAYDGHKCVLCGTNANLCCHHVCYRLFSESLADLMTVCDSDHCKIHAAAKLKFPSGVSVEHVRRLGLEVSFEPWLLPLGAVR
jgi:hypothetical protein